MVHGSWTLKQFCDFFLYYQVTYGSWTQQLQQICQPLPVRYSSWPNHHYYAGQYFAPEASYLFIFIFSLCLNANDTQNQERFICGIIYNRPLPPSFLSHKRNVVPYLLDVAMNKEIFCNTPRGLFCILGCLLCSVLLREHIIIPGINHCQKRTTCFILKYRPKVQTHFGDSLLKNEFSDI